MRAPTLKNKKWSIDKDIYKEKERDRERRRKRERERGREREREMCKERENLAFKSLNWNSLTSSAFLLSFKCAEIRFLC